MFASKDRIQEILKLSNIALSLSNMCQYITHSRVCFVCKHEDTVLISEKHCSHARRSGVFGSCGRGIGTAIKSTPQHCWGCKEYPVTPAMYSG
ncbi:hypothetical protein PG990_005152 [Apiospora arundinis]